VADGPLYWIAEDEWNALHDAIARADVHTTFSIFGESTTVPRTSNDVSIPLLGEVLNLLANNGVMFGAVRNLGVFPGGLALTVPRDEAPDGLTALNAFAAKATTEMLADSELEHGMILHANEPDLVRAALLYIAEGLQIPAAYAGLVINYG
jgi:hypothetical protein